MSGRKKYKQVGPPVDNGVSVRCPNCTHVLFVKGFPIGIPDWCGCLYGQGFHAGVLSTRKEKAS